MGQGDSYGAQVFNLQLFLSSPFKVKSCHFSNLSYDTLKNKLDFFS